MANCKTLILYGLPSAQEAAKSILENHPEIQMITETQNGNLILQMRNPVTEMSLIPLLIPSGISGFRLM